MSKPITEQEFTNIKSKLRWSKPQLVAPRVKRHLAIVTKIAAAKDFREYQNISKAEHPPVKRSLRDELDDHERRLQILESGGMGVQMGLKLDNDGHGDLR